MLQRVDQLIRKNLSFDELLQKVGRFSLMLKYLFDLDEVNDFLLERIAHQSNFSPYQTMIAI